MIIGDKSEVSDVYYVSDINKLILNSTEPICYQGFDAVDVDMICVIN
jgi:hypothetical protein